MDIDAASPAHLYGVVVLNPTGAPPLPQAFVRLSGTDCNPTEAGVAFGSTDGVDAPGGVSYDSNTSSARNAAATTGTNFTPNTDGSALVGASNGYVSEFGNFAP